MGASALAEEAVLFAVGKKNCYDFDKFIYRLFFISVAEPVEVTDFSAKFEKAIFSAKAETPNAVVCEDTDNGVKKIHSVRICVPVACR